MTQTRTAYCSACDRDVRILVTDEADHDAQANIPDAEIICLEIGEQCTGSLCPVGAVSPAVMRVRHLRNGERSVLQPLVKVACESCGRVTDYYIVDSKYATCGDCGTTIERRRLVATPTRD